jgi:hypothetical protein
MELAPEWTCIAYLLLSMAVSWLIASGVEALELRHSRGIKRMDESFKGRELEKPEKVMTVLPGSMTEDFEFGQYIQAFSSSSNRVRYVIIVVTVANLFILSQFWSSRPKSWIHARIHAMRDTLETMEQRRAGANTPLPKAAVIRNLMTEDAVKLHLEQLENAYVSRVVETQIPILGIGFDVNDLGVFGGISFILLLTLLCYCLMRQYENLFLCLWKVQDIHERDPVESRGSKANLLYHALAMAQVFTLPPTLKRWRPNFVATHLAKLLFLLPLMVHALIVWQNYETKSFATTLKEKFPTWGLKIQIAVLPVLLFLGLLCCIYSRACDRRWRKIFFRINPSLELAEQPSWWARIILP